MLIVRYIEVYNPKCLCFLRVFSSPRAISLSFGRPFWKGEPPWGISKWKILPLPFLEEGAPFKNHIYITKGFEPWSLVSRCTSEPIPK